MVLKFLFFHLWCTATVSRCLKKNRVKLERDSFFVRVVGVTRCCVHTCFWFEGCFILFYLLRWFDGWDYLSPFGLAIWRVKSKEEHKSVKRKASQNHTSENLQVPSSRKWVRLAARWLLLISQVLIYVCPLCPAGIPLWLLYFAVHGN